MDGSSTKHRLLYRPVWDPASFTLSLLGRLQFKDETTESFTQGRQIADEIERWSESLQAVPNNMYRRTSYNLSTVQSSIQKAVQQQLEQSGLHTEVTAEVLPCVGIGQIQIARSAASDHLSVPLAGTRAELHARHQAQQQASSDGTEQQSDPPTLLCFSFWPNDCPTLMFQISPSEHLGQRPKRGPGEGGYLPGVRAVLDARAAHPSFIGSLMTRTTGQEWQHNPMLVPTGPSSRADAIRNECVTWTQDLQSDYGIKVCSPVQSKTFAYLRDKWDRVGTRGNRVVVDWQPVRRTDGRCSTQVTVYQVVEKDSTIEPSFHLTGKTNMLVPMYRSDATGVSADVGSETSDGASRTRDWLRTVVNEEGAPSGLFDTTDHSQSAA